MRKKTILINYIGTKGAGPEYSLEMTKALINTEYNIYAVVSDKMENLEEWKKIALTKLIILEGYTNRISFLLFMVKFFFSSKFKTEFINIKVDYIYVPMIQPATSLVNNFFKKSKKIITLHDPIPHRGSNPIINFIRERVNKQSDLLIILSNTFKSYCMNKYSKSQNEIVVIPHAMFDYEKYSLNKTDTNIHNNDMINFLFFGRITDYKGLEILGQAYSKLEKEYSNITLTIAGDGDFKKYKSYYLGLKNFNLINNWIKDSEVSTFFKGKKVVTVLPYKDGTQSGIIPIAMFFRSLVVGSNVGGIEEQITEGKTGVIFKNNNVVDLYEKMKMIVDDFESFTPLINNAEILINSKTWDKSVDILIEKINLNI